MKHLNRRDFLINSGAAAALAATPGMAYSQVVGSAAPFDDYRALVCVFLHGGNDSLNMLVPRSDAEYTVYANARQNLAIPKEQLLAIDPLTPDGAQYGLHPVMGGIQAIAGGALGRPFGFAPAIAVGAAASLFLPELWLARLF